MLILTNVVEICYIGETLFIYLFIFCMLKFGRGTLFEVNSKPKRLRNNRQDQEVHKWVYFSFFLVSAFKRRGVALKEAKESDKWQKESPPLESRGPEQTPLHSKLSLREDSRCGWIYSKSQTRSTVYV